MSIQKIVLCQLNPTTGDIGKNLAKTIEVLDKTAKDRPDLLIFPELFIQGYPPRDLLEQSWFINNGLDAIDSLSEISTKYPDTAILTGIALPDTVENGRGLFNSAILIYNGKIIFHQNKSLLPTYDVFDESRYFDSAEKISICEFKGVKLGITICEDAWNDPDMWAKPRYSNDPVAELANHGAELLINISASPFHMGKEKLRFSLMQNHAKKHNIPLLFINMVGANDELVFDGHSLVFDKNGVLRDSCSGFCEELLTININDLTKKANYPSMDTIGNMHKALLLGIHDYVHKCGFSNVLLGLSGGIDSAVTCALAAQALGCKHVLGITMPSKYSSMGSISDSEKLADNIGIEFKEIPIRDAYNAYLTTLNPHFNGKAMDLTEENIQARIRGDFLMAMSNKFGSLLLTTGNKSELAVGYSTLYGDMCGGLGVIADVYKTTVYDLARYINRNKEIIPESTITKPPSAELRLDQKDQDSLPPYDILDAILKMLIEDGKSHAEVTNAGFDTDIIAWVIHAIKINEHKRRQAPPGIKITQKAFGSGRRFPIAARYIW